MAQVEITYKDGRSKISVVMTAASMEFFKRAAADPALNGRSGAELVAALTARAQDGLLLVQHYRDGELNDGPNGEAAVVEFNDLGGRLEYRERYRDGKLNDGPNGERAWENFCRDGVLWRGERYRDGKLNDGPNGERAWEQFNDKGVLMRGERYRDGKLNDGPNGEAAVEEFNDKGVLMLGEHYRDGECTGVLTEQQVREINCDIRTAALRGAFGNQFRVLAL